VLALGGLALTVMLIAAGARRALVVSWLAAAAAGGIALAVAGGLGAVGGVVVAFNIAEGVAVALAAWSLCASHG
jgi:hypothetical protein